MPGQGVCQGVSLYLGLCPFPRVLWLLLIGLVLCNDGKRSTLGLPRVPPTLHLAGELSRAISSQASARHPCPAPTC